MPDSLPDLLRSLPPEEAKAALSAIVPVYEARKRENPLGFFQYKSAGQKRFASSQAFGRIAWCGNRGGKSEIGAVEAARWALNKHPYRKVPLNAQGWVASPSEKAQKILQKKIRKYVPDSRIAHIVQSGDEVYEAIYLLCNRCNTKPREKRGRGALTSRWVCQGCGDDVPLIGFRTYEQDLNKWMGEGNDWYWPDEEPPRKHHKEGLARLLGRPLAGWWLTYTPVLGLPWIKEEYIDTPDTERKQVIRWSTYENEALSKADLKAMESEYPDDAERKLRFYGEYTLHEGLIFKMWKPEFNEVTALPSHLMLAPTATRKLPRLKPDLDIWCGIDTGKNFHAVYAAIDYNGDAWVFAEVYSFEEETFERAEKMKRIEANWGIDRVGYRPLDPSSQFEIDLARYGIYTTKYDHGWKAAKDATVLYIHGAQDKELKQPGLRILSAACPILLQEIKLYRWEPAKQSGPLAGVDVDGPLKKDDHGVDALMLILEQKPAASTRGPRPESEMSEIERDLRQAQAELRERNDEREAEMSVDPLAEEY